MMAHEKKELKVKVPSWQFNWIVSSLRGLVCYPMLLAIQLFAWIKCRGVKNFEHVKGPVIFAVNHHSSIDPVIVLRCLPFAWHKVTAPSIPDLVWGIPPLRGQWLEQFRRRAVGLVCGFFARAYPFGPTIGMRRSLAITGEQLDHGYNIIVFPEGERTFKGEINKFKQGAGLLALEMGVPVIPVRLRGMFEILPRGQHIPKPGHGSVTFGKPVKFTSGMSYLAAAKAIEKAVRAL